MSRKNVISLLVIIASLAIIAPIGLSQLSMGQNLPKPVISKMAVLGNGIAINPNDLTDFKLVRAGIATVKLHFMGEERSITKGIIFLDQDRYVVNNIEFGNETIDAKLFVNGTEVGSLHLELTLKGNKGVWVGDISVNGETYKIYITDVKRKFQPSEVKEKISEFCKEHPAECVKNAKGIASAYCEKNPTDPSCREKIANYCKDHPKDQRCVALQKVYCLKHFEDQRCREFYSEYCEKNKESMFCNAFKVRATQKFCKNHPNARICKALQIERKLHFCLENPNSPECQQMIEIAKKNKKKFEEKAKLAVYCAYHQNETKCQEFCEVYPLACKQIPKLISVFNKTGIKGIKLPTHLTIPRGRR
ncbi:MAG: hypothetical protein B6U78_00795 [Candidatus Aenigmarchaeota archaeon ex4484_224]|nr:MAG: hypothetical protein B6U78_00795 [Candidatus Aenigmarchaeota archaeon ex4484_224]